MKRTIALSLAAICTISAAYCAGVTSLRCEYNINPINVDTDKPRFTWISEDMTPAQYSIVLSTSQNLDTPLWQQFVNIPTATYIGATPLMPHSTYYWQVVATDTDGNTVASPVASFTMGKMTAADWSASWISDNLDKEEEAAPMFRKEFTVPEGTTNAKVYITSAGYNQVKINGKRIDDTHMNPGYTHFDKRLLYDVVDVTDLLTPGSNVITAVLGNGFYNCQSKAVWDFETARWRGRPSMMCEIRATGADGRDLVVAATDASWRTATGPYTYNNIYSGDRYDGRLEPKGWETAGFNDSKWSTATVVSAPAPLLRAQMQPAIRPTEVIEPRLLKSWGDTVFLFDMGKNIPGVTELTVKGKKGTHFKVSHGELLKDNGRLQQGNIDVYYRPQKPGEKFQTDEFTLRGTGKEETFCPMFTYHGFRYAEVVADRPVRLTSKNIKGLMMHSDLERVGSFKSSDPLLNKIYDATMLSYVGNLHSIPTDCPQREKNGWTADAHASIDLALLNYDGLTFYEKWMNDFIDNQRESGNIAGIIPSAGWGYGDWPGPVWDAALFIIPDALYNYYGDKRVIENLYPTMERYFNWDHHNETEEGLLKNGIGDWLSYKAQTPTDYTSSVYYFVHCKLMGRFATLLGKDARPYLQKAAELRDKINAKYFNADDSTYANGTQAALGVALYNGIVPADKEKAVAARLRDIVAANNHFLDFGLLGTKTVLRMLTKYGYVDDAYLMATKTDAPSWGYWMEKCGYTTLPETWTLSPEFHDASINHVFFGDISAWMTSDLAGINLDPSAPGFSHIIFAPHFPEGLESAEATYKSVKGDIAANWHRNGNHVTMTVTIPSGTTATFKPTGTELGSGTHTINFDI